MVHYVMNTIFYYDCAYPNYAKFIWYWLIVKYKIWYESVQEVKLRGFAGIALIEKISSNWAANPQELYWPQAF